MKKQIFIKTFLIALMLAVVSCSGDNDTYVSSDSAVLVKKITETVNYGSEPSETNTIEFTYDSNNVLLYTMTGTDKTEFSYLGNKVTKSVAYQNGVVKRTNNFFYEGDYLTKIVAEDSSQSTTKFTYTNGILSSRESGYYSDGNYILSQKEDYVFNAGNVVETIRSSYFLGTSIYKLVYTYDANYSPFKDMNPYLRLFFASETLDGLNLNNPLTRNAYFPVDSTTPETQHYDILYNANDFPVQIEKITSSNFVISDVKIEYN